MAKYEKSLEQIKENLEPLHKGPNDRFSVLSRVAMKIFEGFGEALFKEFIIGWELLSTIHYTRPGTFINHPQH